ncbi:MAG TPA: quinone-dependent dihydroorotate dehydrogenase [Vicinamibacterales bacterium]|nr:quinone-dependent dihydroorotate dehydrogenase [Vicinamibacterales bacterium]
MSFYTRVLRPALFALDAERAHDLTLGLLSHDAVARILRRLLHTPADPRLAQRLFDLEFRHPVGLAAGLDKQGTAAGAWAALGFAFAEIGTVTPRPQPGNPRPRLFRLPAERALINRFGFNSDGAERVAAHLAGHRPPGLVIGINAGRNRGTPNEHAANDYLHVVERLHPAADYFVINVSSPNTAGLRDLQESRALRTIVEQVAKRLRELQHARNIPVLVKVSPDAPSTDLLRSVDAALEGGAAGIIATNTTTAREGLPGGSALAGEAGGLSGVPLKGVATAICRLLFSHLRGRVPIIGVGGLFTADDVYERIRAGAALVQLYTALIYEGPGVVNRIVAGLAERLSRDGFSHMREAVGVDAERRQGTL